MVTTIIDDNEYKLTIKPPFYEIVLPKKYIFAIFRLLIVYVSIISGLWLILIIVGHIKDGKDSTYRKKKNLKSNVLSIL